MKKICLLFAALLNPTIAQMVPQPLPELSHLEGDNYVFGWEGLPERVYFIQTASQVSSSNDLSWQYAPDIRVGTGYQIEMGFSATSQNPEFFRLVYTDYSGSLDPNLADFDNDGFTNLEEAIANTDPFNDLDFPNFDTNNGGNGNIGGGASGTGTNWTPPWEYQLTHFYDDYVNFGIFNPNNSNVGLFNYANGEGILTQLSFDNLIGVNQVSFLQIEPNEDYDDSDPDSEQWNFIGVVTLSEDNPIWSKEAPEVGTRADGLLVPIEIIQPKVTSSGSAISDGNSNYLMEAVSQIRFDRWRYATAVNFDPIFRYSEADRFRIRIKKIEGLELSCSVRTKDLSRIQGVVSTEEPWVTINLEEMSDYQGWLISKPHFIVGDSPDAETYNGENTVNYGVNDATFLASEESTIEVKINDNANFVAPFLVRDAVGYAELNLICLSPFDVVSETTIARINSQFERARDAFRQVGVELIQLGDIQLVKPTETLESIFIDGQDYITPTDSGIYSSEMFDLFASTDKINCVFSAYPINTSSSTLGTWSTYTDLSSGDYLGGYLVVHIQEAEYAFAHEVGHALNLNHSNSIQSEESFYEDPYQLMSPKLIPFVDSHKDGKRFRWGAIDIMKDSRYFNSNE